VIALSPRTLLATNRFVCEVCNKGFQREQNLQLHRRGHNLPWKLKQKNPLQAQRRRVYLCPEPTCVHHDPSRALGDLTGIKKHYCRKHGEKKWKCDKCNKRYAVQSDWKAHSKTCGTREYRCDCGTLFSRSELVPLFPPARPAAPFPAVMSCLELDRFSIAFCLPFLSSISLRILFCAHDCAMMRGGR
jgi:transposase-like protein